jgi:hypothetical protein
MITFPVEMAENAPDDYGGYLSDQSNGKSNAFTRIHFGLDPRAFASKILSLA